MDAVTFQARAMELEKLMYQVSWSMLRNQEDCADAVQEALTRAWQKRDTLKNEERFRPWMMQILSNTCRDMLRSGWFRMRKKSVPLDVMPELEQQEDEHAREIAAAVLSLPGKYREVMVLYYEQGMRIREIAEALHMPLNSVSSRLRRAKALLRNEVEGGNDA